MCYLAMKFNVVQVDQILTLTILVFVHSIQVNSLIPLCRPGQMAPCLCEDENGRRYEKGTKPHRLIEKDEESKGAIPLKPLRVCSMLYFLPLPYATMPRHRRRIHKRDFIRKLILFLSVPAARERDCLSSAHCSRCFHPSVVPRCAAPHPPRQLPGPCRPSPCSPYYRTLRRRPILLRGRGIAVWNEVNGRRGFVLCSYLHFHLPLLLLHFGIRLRLPGSFH